MLLLWWLLHIVCSSFGGVKLGSHLSCELICNNVRLRLSRMLLSGLNWSGPRSRILGYLLLGGLTAIVYLF